MEEKSVITDEAQTEVKSESPEAQSERTHKNILFGTIGYDDELAYENFLQKMNISQAVFVLVSSANFAQAKGSFNLLESEVLANAIRVIRKSSTPTEEEPPQSNETENQ